MYIDFTKSDENFGNRVIDRKKASIKVVLWLKISSLKTYISYFQKVPRYNFSPNYLKCISF